MPENPEQISPREAFRAGDIQQLRKFMPKSVGDYFAANPEAYYKYVEEVDKEVHDNWQSVGLSRPVSVNTAEALKELETRRRELVQLDKSSEATLADIKNAISRVRAASYGVARLAICPFCGRELHIPPCERLVTIGCKGCRNYFRYDPLLDAITLPRGSHVKRLMSRRQRLVNFLAIVLAIAIGAGIIWHIMRKPAVEERPAPAVSADSIDDVRRELKSLTE